MEEGYSTKQFLMEINTRIRDIEEKQKVMQDRVLLTGKTLVNERDKNFSQMEEIKKMLFSIKEDSLRMKELLHRMTEQLASTARKEELMIIQRQLDLVRNK